MRPSFRTVLLFLLLLTGLRLAYVGRAELSPDEAYYQMWSERLDWGYYSKGPGVAAAIRLGTMLFGVSEFGVRCLSPVLALGTSLVLYGLARRLYGASVAAWTVLLLNLIPIFQAGSLLMTIDPLSVFFWSAAMAAVWLALEKAAGSRQQAEENGRRMGGRGRLGWWLLAGACVGLGFLCKYTNALELLSIALALALVPRWRGEFRRAGFYAMLLVAAAVGSPPVFWNAGHAWITLSHLHDRGRLGAAFGQPLREFAHFLGAHAGVYSPLMFAGLLVALVWGWRAAYPRLAATDPQPGAERARFLLAFSLPILALYTLLAFKTSGEPNWTAPGFVSLCVLAAAQWHGRARASRVAAAYAVAALALALLTSLFMLDTDMARGAGLAWRYRHDPTARLLGWRRTAQGVADLRRQEERELGAPVFLIANRYQLAAELNFYLPARPIQGPGHPPVYLPESQNMENQFSFWPGYDQIPASAAPPDPAKLTTSEDEFRFVGASPFAGRSALFVTDDERHLRLPDAVERGFEECGLVAQFEVRRRGLPLRRVRVWACFNYRGVEL